MPKIKMKGVSAWIFIIISVILGLITISVGAIFILRSADVTEKQIVLQQFSNLGVEISRICLKGGVSQVTYMPISLPESTRAIYVANASDESSPDKVSEYITNGRSGTGTYLCLQFFDENIPRCNLVSCDMIFTYVGTPSLKSTLQTILARLSGNSPTNKFYLKINKTDYNLVQTSAIPLIGENLPPIITTTTLVTTSITTKTTITTTTAGTFPPSGV